MRCRTKIFILWLILEEGLPLETLKKLIQSMAKACQSAGIQVVTGDTKVVQKGAIDKVFINTAGIGVIPNGLDWGVHRIQPGDQIIVSGTLGGSWSNHFEFTRKPRYPNGFTQ